MAKDQQQLKEEETTRLIDYIVNQKLWVENINIDNYVSQGAEQKVYLKDGYCCFIVTIQNLAVKKPKKADLPTKICVACKRPFTWRKKLERCWDEVLYCSEGCKKKRN